MRAMFDEHDDKSALDSAEAAIIDEWKAKLVLANVHVRRFKELKKLISSELSDRIKHYEKLQGALADAVRFKSTQELYRVFEDQWEMVVDELKPLDKYHDSLKVWMDEQHDKEAG